MSVAVADERVRGVEGRGVFGPGFLFSLFRVAAWMAFFGGAAATGALVLTFEAVMGLDLWGWIAMAVVAFVGVFWTVILWGFLLLLARIADYIDYRTHYADGG